MSLITCNFCGESFGSVEDFEHHINQCEEKTSDLTGESYIVEYQIIYPNGQSKLERVIMRLKSQKSISKSRKLPTFHFDDENPDELPEPKTVILINFGL